MEPTIGDMLEGAADVLERCVAPLVPAGERAAADLGDAIAVLRRVAITWDRIVPHVVAENGAFASLLARASETLEASDDADATTLRASLDRLAEVPRRAQAPAFAEVNDLNRRMRQALVELIDFTAAHDMDELRSEIRAWLRQTVDREMELSGAELRAPHTSEPSTDKAAEA